MLPDPLPTDPDALEDIYQDYVSRDALDPAEFNRLMEARTRFDWIVPSNLTFHAEIPKTLQPLMSATSRFVSTNVTISRSAP